MSASSSIPFIKAVSRAPDLLLTIRGLAALAVVVWHVKGFEGTYPDYINVPGRVAVWIFFGISGYVIGYGFMRGRYEMRTKDLSDFYLNRLLRIYPLFLVVTAVTWITKTIGTGVSPIGLADIPSQIFALQFNHAYVLNGVFWTLGVEMHFYLLAPLLVLVFLRSRKPIVAAAALYAILMAFNWFGSLVLGWSWDGRSVVAHLPHFLTGMFGCYLVSNWRWKPVPTGLLVLAALVVLVVTNLLYHNASILFWIGGGMMVDSVVLLCILAHANFERNERVMANPLYGVLAFFGVLSYGIYAWHAYLLELIPGLIQSVLGTIALSTVVAYLTYRLVEVPALRMKRHPSNSRDAGVAATASTTST